MILKAISISGYKNLLNTTLSFRKQRVVAVVSANNFGKSNLLEAIRFANDFLSAGFKQRKEMMSFIPGIPLTPKIAEEPFRFDMEFELPDQEKYRFVHYGFSFLWLRDDKTGCRIIDEHLEMRSKGSAKYSAFLKRKEGKYRKGKTTNNYRKIVLEDATLAIDVLPSVEDLEYSDVIRQIRLFQYCVCDTLDAGDRFLFFPFSATKLDDSRIRFDDEDVPRALYQLKQLYPEQYSLFEDAIMSLFPEFEGISVQAHDVKITQAKAETLILKENESMAQEQAIPSLPFQIKDKIYRVFIRSSCLNQPVSLGTMSTGTKRIFWLLTNIFIANCTGVACIGIEELETSIHPKMLKGLLEIINDSLENTCVIISSHSPYLVQYLKPAQLYIGPPALTPALTGVAQFFQIPNRKVNKLRSAAQVYDMSIGEYLFELMSGGSASADILESYLEKPHE